MESQNHTNAQDGLENILDPKLLEILHEFTLHLEETKLFQYKPYGWQKKFHTAPEPERALIAANRTGKTYCGAMEASYHATGLYPEWWEGKRFSKPTLGWCGGITNESLRDIIQKELLGGTGDEKGTGAIPKTYLGKLTTRQAGIGGVVDTAKVKHISGGWSTIVFKSYEQGWRKWQGTAPDYIWMDEEPDDFKIYTEARTRIITSDGTMWTTFTPLSGQTELVDHFNAGKPGTFVMNVTWDDIEHLTEKQKKEALASFPKHEIDARTKGVPMMGQGRVYAIPEEDIICDPFQIPNYYRLIIGVDFGIDHPSATVRIAFDADQDIIYVTQAHKASDMDYVRHASVIKKMGGDDIPVSWPHDGHKRQNVGTGLIETRKQYVSEGVQMLSRSARYKNETGGAQDTEPVIEEIYTRMISGRFKVFSTCQQWLEEFRNYHRKDGKINRVRDDIMSATNYAVMMKRYAQPKYVKNVNHAPTSAIISTK